jgi:hypothetical protein
VTPSRLTVLAFVAFVCAACSKKDATQKASVSPSASAGAAGPDGGGTETLLDPWSAAASLEPEDLGRLALREGSAGLVAGATTDDRRKVAVAALAFAEDFDGLPFLAEAAAGADPALALSAADSACALAARRRTAVAPEDALEVREGCDRMLAVAKDEKRPRVLRLRILRALRMLEDRGCARDLPAVQ